jgi:hypothetical protein
VSGTPNPKREWEGKKREKEKKKHKKRRKGERRDPWRRHPNKKGDNQMPKDHALGWTERTAQHWNQGGRRTPKGVESERMMKTKRRDQKAENAPEVILSKNNKTPTRPI